MSGDVSDRDARKVLREHGHEVGDRGKLSAANWQAYHAIAGGAPDPGDWSVTDLSDPGGQDEAPAGGAPLANPGAPGVPS